MKLLPKNYNDGKWKASGHWFIYFIEKIQTLSIRKAESARIAIAKVMNKKDVNMFFKVLEKAMIFQNLINKPAAIYNMDEAGFQHNNDAGKVVTTKGSKDVHSISSTEKGDTIRH